MKLIPFEGGEPQYQCGTAIISVIASSQATEAERCSNIHKRGKKVGKFGEKRSQRRVHERHHRESNPLLDAKNRVPTSTRETIIVITSTRILFLSLPLYRA